MNDLVKFAQTGGVPADPAQLVAGLTNVGQSLQAGSGGIPFLRLLKSGIYAYGQENIEPEPESRWAINPYSIQHGWACWGDGELLDERMVPFNQMATPKGELPDLGHEWRQQVAMLMQCLDGADEGQQVLYKGTALGLCNAVKELINLIVKQAQTKATHIVPVVELECDSYQHKKHGQIFYPVLPIVDWLSLEGVSEAADSDPEPEAEPEPAAAADAGEAGAAEQEPQKPPRRTRRAQEGDKQADNGSGNRRRRRRS